VLLNVNTRMFHFGLLLKSFFSAGALHIIHF
jgi:hypothetical protein